MLIYKDSESAKPITMATTNTLKYTFFPAPKTYTLSLLVLHVQTTSEHSKCETFGGYSMCEK